MGDDPLKSYFAFVRRRFAEPERLNLDPACRILIGAAKKPRGRLVPSMGTEHPPQSRRRRGAEIPSDGRGAARQGLR
jgi:hypothetical protein